MTASLTRLSEVQPEQVSWLWPGRIPAGKLITLDGDPGVGKSTLAYTIAATITTGGDWPDGTRCEYPGDVLVMSAEDGPGDTIRPRLDAAGADTNRVHCLDGRLMDDEVDPVTLQDVDVLRDAITTTGARLLIVDVLMAYLGLTDSYKDQHMRRVLTPLAALAGETGCAILLLRHPPKSQQAKAIHAGGGSIGIIGAARVGLLAMTDTEDTDLRVLTVSKSNLAAVPVSLAYRLDPVISGGVDTVAVRWLGEHYATADEMVTGHGGDTAVVLALVNARTKTTAHDVTDAYPQISLETARRTLSRLAGAGEILRERRGVYSPLTPVTPIIAQPAAVQIEDRPGMPGEWMDVSDTPCPIVRLSETPQNTGSQYLNESDNQSDKPDMSETESDNRTTVPLQLSDLKNPDDLGKSSESDNRTNRTASNETTHSPDPGQSSISRPEGSATIADAGVGKRRCKTPHCDGESHYRSLCRDCLDLEAADNLIAGVNARAGK